MKIKTIMLPAFAILLICSCGGQTGAKKSSSLEYSFEDTKFDNIYLASNLDPGKLSSHIETLKHNKVSKSDAEGSLAQYFEACPRDTFCYDYHLADGAGMCDIWFFPNSGAFVVRDEVLERSSLDYPNITYSYEASTHWVFKIGQQASKAGYAGWCTYKSYADSVAQVWYNSAVTLKPSVLHKAVPQEYLYESYFDNYSANVTLTGAILGDRNKADQHCRSESQHYASMVSRSIALTFSPIDRDLQEVDPSYHLFNNEQGTPFVPGEYVASQDNGQEHTSKDGSKDSESNEQESSSNTSSSNTSSPSSNSSEPVESISIQYDTVEYRDFDGSLLVSIDYEHGKPCPQYPNNNPTRPNNQAEQLMYQFVGWDMEDQGSLRIYTARYVSCTIGLTISNGVVSSYSGTSNNILIPSFWNYDDVTGISYEAFLENASIKSIKMPDTITSIPSICFSNCSGLESINIGAGVTHIGMRAFANCTSLKSIYIPATVEGIDNYAFEGCSNLTIDCEAASKPFNWGYFWNPDDRPVNWGVQKQ